MRKNLVMLAASMLCLGFATPSFADGAMSDVKGCASSTTALLIDIPEGTVVHSCWRAPKATWHYLADKFGDQNGLGQNIAAATIGIPVGFVWGIPLGAIHGGRHALTTGWDKPFSTDAFIVNE